MPEFELIRPESLDHCLRSLRQYSGEAALIAGGTDLHVLMRAKTRQPRMLIAIGGVPELRFVRAGDGGISFGSALTPAEIAADRTLGRVHALKHAASSIGSPQIRNVGTAGGNLANASPAGDLYPPLLALGARVIVRSVDGERDLDLEDFVRGPGITALRPDELISGISFEKPGAGFYTDFAKIGLRNAVAISVASAAIVARAANGGLEDVRLACGAVADRPIRMRRAEALLEGAPPTAELAREAGEAASRECDPITDIRATAEYRRHVVGVIVSRLVEAAWHDLLE